jgi:hypothetical protein
MNSLQPIYIAGSSIGLKTDTKPFLLPEQAFPVLNNAYVYRERVKKREGLELVGRLRRVLTGQALGNTDGAGNFSGNIIAILTLESSSQIETGSISVTVGAQVFTEPATPDGTLSNGAGGTGTINYATGAITINTNPDLAATPVTIDFNYFPGLPVMGIDQREISAINDEQTIYFDTKYAYVYSGTNFQEFITGTTWNATDKDFFWSTNYRGSSPENRLFFTTNFICNSANPIRYTDGVTWTSLAPLVDANNTLYQARILIPYYGRLVALNVFEGTTAGSYAGAVNIFNRCRFSQIGSPVAADAWRSDQFGKGGFIDAPTNEAIVSAAFFKNTLIVQFERSTWQLRYVGEYGLPFLWERISSDFGSESSFSTILFDEGVLAVGDRAIVSSNAVNVQRIDTQIPDIVFDFRNAESGPERVHGIRDFRRELVFWCYSDAQLQRKFPNKVLVYNYRNNTYAIFRDNVTAFGIQQLINGITWDSTDVFWDDEDVTWDNVDMQSEFPRIVCGNQQGFIHYYGYTSPDEESLAISAIDLTVSPNVITIPDHNLDDGDIIMIKDIIWQSNPTIDLNGKIFRVGAIYDAVTGALDQNNITISLWNVTTQLYENTVSQAAVTYLGNGKVILFPQLYIETKDFNPYQDVGGQVKLSYIDLLTDATPSAAVTLQIFLNSSLSVQGNLIVGNTSINTSLTASGFITDATQANPCVITSSNHGLRTGNTIQINNVLGMTQLNGNTYTVTYIDANTFSIDTDSSAFSTYEYAGQWSVQENSTIPELYLPGSDYAWHRFLATTRGQFFRLVITYDDNLMNAISTHQQSFILNAITLWVRPGGRNVF